MTTPDISALRNDYSDKGIDPLELPVEPYSFFSKWFQQALDSGIAEPNGMVIATAGELSDLSQRTVLMKSFDQSGFFFYTNYDSTKSLALQKNPYISCLFPWLSLHRQVSFKGIVTRTSKQQSATYFSNRPRGSQIGAWASQQSAVLEDREILEDKVKAVDKKYRDQEIPLPPNWGGFHVKPLRVEFWQGRTSRLHDRFVYSLTDDKTQKWSLERLYP